MILALIIQLQVYLVHQLNLCRATAHIIIKLLHGCNSFNLAFSLLPEERKIKRKAGGAKAKMQPNAAPV